MQYQVLARKWRPKVFSEVIGQNHITRSLSNALLNNKIAHAYLFTGSRGTGKTSVARIYAKSLRCTELKSNGEACDACPSCLDFNTTNPLNVLEIDGASNNSVENVRDLISEVDYLPSEGKYKIYIIDEVHMLSTSAFNALLKTLEEPPAHVIFILATTEPQKLLDTVLSRCQRFDFKLVQVQELMSHVQNIAKKEGIRFENERLLKELCKRGRGSVRDTLSLLDQVLCFTEDKNITEEVLVISLGLARESVVNQLLENILSGNMEKVSSTYRSLVFENVSIKNILSPLIDSLYELIQNPDKSLLGDISISELFWIFETLARDSKWALESLEPEKVVEIILQKITARRDFFTKKATIKTQVVERNDSEKKQSVIVSSEEEQSFEEEELDDDYAYTPLDAVDSGQKVSVFSDPARPIIEEKKSPKSTKTWNDFLKWLEQKSPSVSSNLDQGNLIGELNFDSQRLDIVYGFSPEAKVFYDFLVEQKIKDKIIEYISTFFEKEISEISFRLDIQKDTSFLSRAEIRKQKEQKIESEKKEEFLSHHILKYAENLFQTKIDKTITN
ncbi:MAG: DNA polymerase III subunit gamma/tau [Bacteriovoracaceae bacterium]